ncbi:CapA family protein [Aerococcaceae bacterium NML160702]|nr:CapA family protein [Aerococcaceae bacterium NML160702]
MKTRKEGWHIILATASLVAVIIIIWIAVRSLLNPPTIQNNAVASSEATSSEVEEVVTPMELPTVLAGLPAREQEQPYAPIEGEIRLRSVGDILIHDRVSVMADPKSEIYQATVAQFQQEGIAIPPATGDYDFYPMIAKIAPFTQYADITIANLEIPAAYPQYEVSGYPQFNMSKDILEDLKEAGIDIVSNGTNHTLDLWGEGALASIQNLKEAGLMYVGSYESWEDKQTPRIIDRNSIKLGFLTYSYGTNGMPIPEGQEHLISLIDLPVMLEEVAALKQQVDAVVVTLQLGEEYETLPNENQNYVFQALADAGVSLILGGHPHVLQPIAWFNDGQTYAIYSQASFMSGQREADNKQGGITEVTFKRQADGAVQVIAPKFMPIYMLGIEAEKMYETVPLADYTTYAIPDGATWWQTLYERMRTFTSDFTYLTHLETQWTLEASDLHR